MNLSTMRHALFYSKRREEPSSAAVEHSTWKGLYRTWSHSINHCSQKQVIGRVEVGSVMKVEGRLSEWYSSTVCLLKVGHLSFWEVMVPRPGSHPRLDWCLSPLSAYIFCSFICFPLRNTKSRWVAGVAPSVAAGRRFHRLLGPRQSRIMLPGILWDWSDETMSSFTFLICMWVGFRQNECTRIVWMNPFLSVMNGYR